MMVVWYAGVRSKREVLRLNRVKGHIKRGDGPLIGNAGEYAVMSELLKNGFIAAQAPRNARAFDILATKGHAIARIRVKSKTEGYEEWQWVAKRDGTIFPDLQDEQDFVVLVNLKLNTPERNDYFIVPTRQVDAWLREDFERWLAAPGRRGQPHDPNNPKRHLSMTKFAKELERFREAWDEIARP